MGSSVIQLVVLGIVALFLILKLGRVLGRRDGFENVDHSKTPSHGFSQGHAESEDSETSVVDDDIAKFVSLDSDSGQALSAMKEADDAFNVQEFIEGAGRAYEMILTEFASGKLDSILPFISAEVCDSFNESIQQRMDEGYKNDLRFVRLVQANILDARLGEQGEAEITIEFVAELISFVTDKNGEIVEGDDKAVRTQRDVWTFSRDMTMSDPNWCLVETGE